MRGSSDSRPHPFWLTVLLAVAHGGLLVVAFEPPWLWPAAFVIPAVATWLAVRARSVRRAVLVTIVVQWLVWLWLDRWIIPVTVAGFPLLALYMALFSGLFVGLIRLVALRRPGAVLPMALLLPVMWVGVECLRGELAFEGYPWFLVAHPVVEWTIFAQSADLAGVYFVGFLVAAASGALVGLARAPIGPPRRRRAWLGAAIVLLALAANVVYGAVRLGRAPAAIAGPRVLVIQTNLPQDNKVGWTWERQAEDVPHFIELTRSAHRGSGGVDLIVWPETMVPGVGLEPETIELVGQFGERASRLYAWGLAVVELSAELGTPMLVGSPVWLETRAVKVDDGYRLEHDTEYNSAYLIIGSPPFPRYDKVFLTPYGETMPYISRWPALEERLLALGAEGMSFGLDASPEIRRLTLPWDDRATTFATPICFEDTVARVCRRMIYVDGRKEAEALINLSNDGWFGDHDAGRRQHAQIARYRCIENRVPMIRAANTGLSMLIDSGGKVLAAVGPGRYGTGRQEGHLQVTLPIDPRPTLYGRIGDAWGWACLAATVGVVGWALVTGRRGSTE